MSGPRPDTTSSHNLRAPKSATQNILAPITALGTSNEAGVIPGNNSIEQLLSEELSSLKQLCSDPMLSGGGKKPHVGTLYRWSKRGARNAKGDRIRLETILLPAGRCSSRGALRRFIEKLNEGDANPSPMSSPRVESARNAADKKLEQAGW